MFYTFLDINAKEVTIEADNFNDAHLIAEMLPDFCYTESELIRFNSFPPENLKEDEIIKGEKDEATNE